MKRNSFIFVLCLVLVTSIVIRFWVGVYIHDEFGDSHLFIKHRPTLKWHFYSPVGMSDLKLRNLTPEDQQEQLLFNEFVSGKGLSR